MMQAVTLEVVMAVVVIRAFLGLIYQRVEVLLVEIMKVGALEG